MKTVIILAFLLMAMYYVDPIIQSYLSTKIHAMLEGDLE